MTNTTKMLQKNIEENLQLKKELEDLKNVNEGYKLKNENNSK